MKSLRAILAIFAFALCLVSCKRELESLEIVDNQSIAIKATVTSVDSMDDNANTSGKDVFVPGDKIGSFSQLKSMAQTANFLKENSQYAYDTPNWAPATADGKLEYSDDEPIYIYAYYPYTDAASNAQTTINGATLTHTLDTEQEDPAKLLDLDLLWASATNNGTGYSSQRDAVDMQFSHMLTKLSIYVRIIDSENSSATDENIYIDSLQILGTDIFTKTNLDITTGQHTNDAKATNDTISWFSTDLYGKEMSIVSKTDNPTHIADLMLIPFTATLNANKIKYILNFVDGSSNVIPNNFQTIIPVYDPTALSGGTTLNFAPNRHNQITVTIDISSDYVELEASIKDWEEGPSTDLDADRE